MYQIKWDTKTNGIKLNYSLKSGLKNYPRPVFFEELDILGFNKYWSYPKSEKPLLWAIERKYYYKGIEVAKVKGGNIYEKPNITITSEGFNLQLEPVDIEHIVNINRDALFVMENEALDFIEKTFKVYRPDVVTLRQKYFGKQTETEKNKIDYFVVSFSGGKDSQVVLDLVSRVIPVDYYQVIYSDTGMELPSSINVFHETEQKYKKKYPNMKFRKEKNDQSTDDFWKEFGPPSRFHRWCCTVTKTVPFNRALKQLYKDQKGVNNPKVLVFEGVRREESNARATYERIAKGVKHTLVTNVRPVLNWSITEIWLYIFSRNLSINQSYRNGLARVGCSVCPFSNGWSEYIINTTYPQITNAFFSIIYEQTEQIGIKDEEKKRIYIKKENWKKRAGGKGLTNLSSRVDFISQKPDFIAVITEPKENLLEWLKVLGDIHYNDEKEEGELKVKEEYYYFQINKEYSKLKFTIKSIEQYPILISKLKKVLYKATYCIHCDACQLECPTGALATSPHVRINSELCTHCCNCLNFTNKGCLVAKSKHISEGGKKMDKKRTSGIDKYSTFGLRERWLRSFLENSNNWFEIDNQLGTKQVPAMINWLRDSELLMENEKKPSELCKLLVTKQIEINTTWQIILVNLYYNSMIFNWVFNNVAWNRSFDKTELMSLLQNTFDLSEGTLNNPLSAFFNTIEQTNSKTLKNILNIEKNNNTRVLAKKGSDEVSSFAILYSLYKYAEKTNRFSFTVSDLYSMEVDGGPYKIYGISKSNLESKLRGLQDNKYRLIDIALVADLDNINLRKDVTSLDALNFIFE